MQLHRKPASALLSVIAVAVALLLSACAGGSDEVDLSKELPTDIPPGTTIVVADQQNRVQTLFAASGLGENLPYKLEFANFTGGPAVLEAFRSGTADVSYVGDVPPIHAQLTGEQVPIILANQGKTTNYVLATSPSTTAKTAADLRGKRIGYAEGTAQQAVVLRALSNAGLDVSDVELVRLQLAEFSEALGANEIDMAPLNEPRLTRYLRDYQRDGASFIDPETTGQLSQGLSFVYARGQSLTDPAKAAALRHFVGDVIKAQQWTNDHPAEWIDAYYVKNQNVTADDGWRILESVGTVAFPPLDDSVIARQQDTIDLIDRAGGLPTKITAADGFDLRFAPVVEEARAAAGAPQESGDIQR